MIRFAFLVLTGCAHAEDELPEPAAIEEPVETDPVAQLTSDVALLADSVQQLQETVVLAHPELAETEPELVEKVKAAKAAKAEEAGKPDGE